MKKEAGFRTFSFYHFSIGSKLSRGRETVPAFILSACNNLHEILGVIMVLGIS